MKKKGQRNVSAHRLERVQRIFSIVMYACIFGALCYPWMLIVDERYSLLNFVMQMKKSGLDSLIARAGLMSNPFYASGVKVNLATFFVFAVVCLFYVITVFIRKDWNVNLAAVLLSIALLYFGQTPYMLVEFCGNYVEAVLYTGIIMVLPAVECIGRKVIENWDVTVKEKDTYQEKAKKEKAERRERLYFPGKYKKLFYRVVWKNFQRNLKDYMVLLLCNALVFAFVLAGFGLQKLTAAGDTSLELGYPSGAGKILLRSVIELGAVGLFMLVLLLLYYLRKRIPEYGVFRTLGIRKKTMYFTMGLELGLGAALSLLVGGVCGTCIVIGFQKNLSGIEGGFLSPLLLLKALGVMLVIYLITFFVTHDLFVGFRMGSSTELQMMKEWMPGRFHPVFVAAGAGVTAVMVYWYLQNANYENFLLLGGCFAGIYLILRFGIAGYLLHTRKKKGSLLKLLVQHPFYHKSRSSVWYIFGLCVLQICILAVFSVQYFSGTVMEEENALLPYDLVLCANAEYEEDEALLEKMKEMEGVSAADYPMVRVSGTDGTEMIEAKGADPVRSQNIGIPESVYHALKKAQDPDYREEKLGLDPEGETIYVVHQQSKTTKAQPIDYKTLRSKPLLYTGPVCISVDPYSQQTSFSERRIIGEEISSLIGVFCQGERENLVVFSDEYFEKAKEIWKITDPYNGKILRGDEILEYEPFVYQGPTKLITVKADEEALKELEPELNAFRERHEKDEEYDRKVKSYYLKTDAGIQIDTELQMQEAMGKLLICIFFVAEILLLGIKMMTEKRINVRRAEFLNCMGMRKKERKRLIRWEMGTYYLLVTLVSAVISVILLFATFHARLYGPADINAMLEKLIPFIVCELAASGVVMWLLTEWNIRQIEKKIKEV